MWAHTLTHIHPFIVDVQIVCAPTPKKSLVSDMIWCGAEHIASELDTANWLIDLSCRSKLRLGLLEFMKSPSNLLLSWEWLSEVAPICAAFCSSAVADMPGAHRGWWWRCWSWLLKSEGMLSRRESELLTSFALLVLVNSPELGDGILFPHSTFSWHSSCWAFDREASWSEDNADTSISPICWGPWPVHKERPGMGWSCSWLSASLKGAESMLGHKRSLAGNGWELRLLKDARLWMLDAAEILAVSSAKASQNALWVIKLSLLLIKILTQIFSV